MNIFYTYTYNKINLQYKQYNYLPTQLFTRKVNNLLPKKLLYNHN